MASPQKIIAGQAFISLFLDSSKLNAETKKASGILQNFADKSAAMFQSLVGMHYTMQSIVRPIIDVYARFDDQMRLTGAVTGATGEQFQMLSDRAKQLGRDTAFTASQVAEGMTSLGRMGFSSNEIDTAISSVMDLSRATGTDLAQSADIAANSLRIFGLQSSEMSHVADILTATANGSAQTLVDLFEALKMAGPQAATAKESITDVSAAIGVMANVGIKGSLAGTALRRAYINMANSKIQDFLKQYNIQTVDTTGNLRKMKDILIDISRAMKGMGTAEKMTFAEDVFDMRGSFVGLSLGGNVEAMQQFIDKLEQADGVAAKTAAGMESGMGGALRMLSSAFESVVIALGESANGLVSLSAKFGTDLLRGTMALIKALPEVAMAITSIGAIAVPATAALIALAIGMKGVSLAAGLCGTSIGALNKAFALLVSNPIVTALAVVAAAITYHIGRLRVMSAEIAQAREQQATLNRELKKQSDINTATESSGNLAADYYRRLQELAGISRQQKLTNAEIIEADALIQRLAPFGSSYYAHLDAIAGSLTLAADAQRQFAAAANATRLPGLEAERDQLLQMVDAIKAERDAIVERNGARSAMQNQVAEEQADVRINAMMPRINELQAIIDDLKKPILLDIRPPQNQGPSMADLENAAKTLEELEAKINDAGKTDAQRREDELKRQNDLYREQIGLLRQVVSARADQSRAAVSDLERQRDTARFDTSAQRDAEIARVTGQLESARENATSKVANVAGWKRWKAEGNELFDEAQLRADTLALGFAEEKVKSLTRSLDELHASASKEEIDLKIKAEFVKLDSADAEMEALAKRLSEYDEKVRAQREQISRAEASKIMAGIDDADRSRRQDAEDAAWQRSIDDLLKSGSLADAIAQATVAMNAEVMNEDSIRRGIADAMDKNDPESLRRLADDLRRSQDRQDYIAKLIAEAEGSSTETVARDFSGRLGSFITSDILNLTGSDIGPQEETARNTRATAANLAMLIDVVRRQEGLSFS